MDRSWGGRDTSVEMGAHAPSEVAEIFKRLVGHRQRVVLQVAGVPAAAMRAAIDQGHSVLEKHDPDFDGPVRRTFRQWLENKASANFLADLAFALTPWRKESQNRQWEEAIANTDAQIALTRLHGELGDLALTMSDKDARFLDDQDTSFLSFMVEQGHLPELPRVINRYSPGTAFSPEARSAPGVPGTVIMRGDRKGDFYGHLPEVRHLHNKDVVDKHFSDFISEYARNLTDGNAPVEITDHRQQVYTRWFVLMHEVAHTRFTQIEAPFQPKHQGIGDKQQQAVNRWITGPYSVAPIAGNTLLNENHSDALAAMLLLEATGHDPKAMAALQHFAKDRSRTRESADIFNHKRLSDGGMGSHFSCIHATEWAMKRVIDNVDEWAGKPPQEIRDIALAYASDGLMDFINPDRIMAGGGCVGRAYSEAIVAPEPCRESPARNLLIMAVTHAHGIDPIEHMRGFDVDPTVIKIMQSSWEAIKPQVDAILAQEIVLDNAVVGTMRDSVCSHSTQALIHLNDVLADPILPINDPGHRDYQAMVEAYQRDLPLMHQAFGAEPPRITGADVAQWRKVRYGDAGKPEHSTASPAI